MKGRVSGWVAREDLAALGGRFGEIIAERTADFPPEQFERVAKQTIIDVLRTQRDVPLVGLVRLYVIMELEQAWLSKTEVRRQRRLELVENSLVLAKVTRKTKPWEKAGKPKPKGFEKTAHQAVAAAYGFSSADTLKQFLRRGRRARKKPRP